MMYYNVIEETTTLGSGHSNYVFEAILAISSVVSLSEYPLCPGTHKRILHTEWRAIQEYLGILVLGMTKIYIY